MCPDFSLKMNYLGCFLFVLICMQTFMFSYNLKKDLLALLLGLCDISLI